MPIGLDGSNLNFFKPASSAEALADSLETYFQEKYGIDPQFDLSQDKPSSSDLPPKSPEDSPRGGAVV